jgi:hypothetical protein
VPFHIPHSELFKALLGYGSRRLTVLLISILVREHDIQFSEIITLLRSQLNQALILNLHSYGQGWG